jgi:hypothetical protein
MFTVSRTLKLDSPALDSIAASFKTLAVNAVTGLSVLMDVRAKVDQLIAAQAANEAKEMAFEDDILAKIAAQKTVDDGVAVLLGQLTGLIKSNPGPDPVKQAQALALLQANTDEVSAALLANTPAAPVPAAGP